MARLLRYGSNNQHFALSEPQAACLLERNTFEPGWLLISCSIADYFTEVLEAIKTTWQDYESPSRMWFFHKPYVLIYSPEDFQVIFWLRNVFALLVYAFLFSY